MSGTALPAQGNQGMWRMALAALAAIVVSSGWTSAQTPDAASPAMALVDSNIQQAGCSTCGGGSGDLYGGVGNPLGCATCVGGGCDGPRCVPGRADCCDDCQACNMFGRFWCGLSAMCCPDPCYQPCYIPAADAGFFVDSAKPVSRTRLRWDAGVGGTTPDRAEYFWSRIGGRGPANRESRVNYHEITQYSEFAVDRFSFFTYMPYRSLNPTNNPHAAGFGNLTLGTKSMLVDSEILLLTTQFKTTIPIANAGKGIDNGHTTLEPSLLFTVKVMPDTYFQGQLAEWIPLGGDQAFAGAMLHYHFSLNHVLVKPSRNFQVIGTVEFGGYTFQDGLFSPFPAGAPVRASGTTYFNVGPGIRFVFCQKFDAGFGVQFGTSQDHFAQELYRTEIRWRF